MSAELVFQAVEATALVIAFGFAMPQVRQYRRNKHREAALEMLHSFQTPSFARAIIIVFNHPDWLFRAEIERAVGDELHLLYAMTSR